MPVTTVVSTLSSRTPISVMALGRARLRSYVRTVAIVDVTVITVAAIGGFLLRFAEDGGPIGDVPPYGLVGGILILAWLLSLRLLHCYDPRVLGYGAEEYRHVMQSSFRLAGIIAISGYVFDPGVSRLFLGFTFVIGTSGLLSARWIARRWLHRARARGLGWSHRVLVVGDVPHVMELVGQLRREAWTGYRVVGACIPHALSAPTAQHLGDVPIVGSFRTIVEAATAAEADTIAITNSSELTASRLRRLGWQLEGSGIDLVVAPALTDVAGPRIRTRPVAGLPLIHVEPPDLNGRAKVVKGLTDKFLAGLGLLLISPLLLLIAVSIKFGSKGPVFFRQRRVGQDGEEFDVYKFRTMFSDAEARLAELSHLNEGDGLLFKMRNDPRVTAVGRLLRRYSLDELPQLLNVMGGSMSLVGPRPPLPSEVAQYDGDVARRLLVKPGITGLWQVSGRSDLTWEDGIRLDLYYVENWSLMTDLLIMWKTVGAVVRARGAY
ncbi:MAG TPA: polyprenyl glycosylphosphotransferase [Micromonosporaceae bacterium]|nr:polyprenyl glycosylphosphotransferase [Micromonosporaceae bacterium]HCU51677.1 polyprenyl glycosylphosphotransferase [Micromonosporaceae bacterium]